MNGTISKRAKKLTSTHPEIINKIVHREKLTNSDIIIINNLLTKHNGK